MSVSLSVSLSAYLSLSLSLPACLSFSIFPSLSACLSLSLSAWQVLLLLLLNQLRRASVSLVLPFPHFPVVAFNLISFGRFVAFIEQCVNHLPSLPSLPTLCSAQLNFVHCPRLLSCYLCVIIAFVLMKFPQHTHTHTQFDRIYDNPLKQLRCKRDEEKQKKREREIYIAYLFS